MSDNLVKRLESINRNYDLAAGIHADIRAAAARIADLEAENARLHIENAIFIRLLQRARRLVDPCLPNKVSKWQQDVRAALVKP